MNEIEQIQKNYLALFNYKKVLDERPDLSNGELRYYRNKVWCIPTLGSRSCCDLKVDILREINKRIGDTE